MRDGVAPEVLDGQLRSMTGAGASDLLVTAGAPPMARVDGALAPIPGEPALAPAEADARVRAFLGPRLAARMDEDGDVDFAFTWGEAHRFRGNAYLQRGVATLALRRLPAQAPTPAQIGLPASAVGFAEAPRGLVLVTGPTGSGKTTTMAALIDHITARRPCHVITIEDPIEYEFSHRLGVVTQRQVGRDSPSFAAALRAALREDPDVVLVGEMRDLESIQTTLTLAETGHLVLATLHTNDTAQAIDRVIDVFPADRQALIRVQLGATLVGVVGQRLVPRVGGGRVAAYEVMVATPAVRAVIRDGRTEQLRNLIVTGASSGMQTLEASLRAAVGAGAVRLEDAVAVSAYPADLAR